MKFLIISHAIHKIKSGQIYAYAPYVREMNLWLKYVDEVEIVAPFSTESISEIELDYSHDRLTLTKIPSLAFISIKEAFASILKIPRILVTLFKSCKTADHIHLRCPGNIGLLGCCVQMLFPKKTKTAKYAGNWDPKSKQPLSYKFQKIILNNTFLSKKMTVLVYGKWKRQSKNIKPFFTATFTDKEKESYTTRNYDNSWYFVFVGSLVEGKRPLLAIKIVEALYNEGKDVKLSIYGDGILMHTLNSYIIKNELTKIIILHGNQNKETIKKAYREAHFSLLLSKSEGWPKALAEAMFFGVIPIATPISCVPYMLDFGNRGILVSPEVTMVKKEIMHKTSKILNTLSENALSWSQQYTLEKFENDIKNFL